MYMGVNIILLDKLSELLKICAFYIKWGGGVKVFSGILS